MTGLPIFHRNHFAHPVVGGIITVTNPEISSLLEYIGIIDKILDSILSPHLKDTGHGFSTKEL